MTHDDAYYVSTFISILLENIQRIGSKRGMIIRYTDNNIIRTTIFDHTKILDLYRKTCFMPFSYLTSSHYR